MVVIPFSKPLGSWCSRQNPKIQKSKKAKIQKYKSPNSNPQPKAWTLNKYHNPLPADAAREIPKTPNSKRHPTSTKPRHYSNSEVHCQHTPTSISQPNQSILESSQMEETACVMADSHVRRVDERLIWHLRKMFLRGHSETVWVGRSFRGYEGLCESGRP